MWDLSLDRPGALSIMILSLPPDSGPTRRCTMEDSIRAICPSVRPEKALHTAHAASSLRWQRTLEAFPWLEH